MTDEYIKDARTHLTSSNRSEVSVMEELPDAADIWRQIQQVKQEMNEAKRKAAELAAKPYLAQIAALEAEYALVLKLTS